METTMRQENTERKSFMGIGKLSRVLTILAVPLLGLGLMGVIGAAELNQQLQEMGMGFISIDEAIFSMKSLAGYTGQNLNDYFTGSNAFMLFTVIRRIPLLIAGAGSLVSGAILAAVHSKNAGVSKTKRGEDWFWEMLPYMYFSNR